MYSGVKYYGVWSGVAWWCLVVRRGVWVKFLNVLSVASVSA